jgi:lysophospholipid acyltransferase (LPLAT)-like uncharacterized protein
MELPLEIPHFALSLLEFLVKTRLKIRLRSTFVYILLQLYYTCNKNKKKRQNAQQRAVILSTWPLAFGFDSALYYHLGKEYT